MGFSPQNNLAISVEKQAGRHIAKASFPLRYGKYSEISTSDKNIEVTGNFLIGEILPPEHYHALAELFGGRANPANGKGPVYLSPIMDSPKKRELLPQFLEIKKQSKMPVYIYLIQRL
jgi:hypothetical protein